MIEWDKYKNFQASEFDCSFTGNNGMRSEFLDVLQQIRTMYNKPMIISSGYRDPSHPIERDKERVGVHTYGLAADIKGNPLDLLELAVIAYGHGIRRIGFGISRGFLHLDIGDQLLNFPSVPWDYA